MAVKVPFGDEIALRCKAASLPAPVPEYRFAPPRRWRFDQAWPGLMVAAEYEGMARRGGKSRHTTITGYANDCEKYNESAILGWLVIRVTALHVQSGQAWEWIERTLRQRGEA